MAAVISMGNNESQPEIFPLEMPCADNGLVKWGMGKKPKRQYRTLYIGQWIDALGKSQREVVKATGYSQGYISNVSAGRKKDPGGDFLLTLSEFLEITVNDLYRAPPARSQIASLRDISPEAREGLLRKKTATSR